MNDTIYVTTTIPYVNAPPHVGFALELVQADALARYHRLLGRNVRLQTGTDENAFKNVLSARERGVPIARFVAENAERFRELSRVLGISADRFIRTTEPEHARAVHAFIERLQPADLYEASYGALYCPGCEDFYLERDLSAGCCPEHNAPVIEVAERNHFFRLSRYQQEIRTLIASRQLRVLPEARETEVLQFIDGGLRDISISRDAARADGWGIPFPGDPAQVVYVWIDALINYLTGLGFPNDGPLTEFWSSDAEKLHVIGKNVWKFHAVYWPALLLSAGLPLPDRIFTHGFLTSEGRKISKSNGAAPDPLRYIECFGVDAVRYYLLRYVRPFDDADFSVERLGKSYESDLANSLGNLCSRLTALCEVVGVSGSPVGGQPKAPAGFHDVAREFRFDQALALLWDEVARINREITTAEPWADVKAGRHDAVRNTLADWVNELQAIAYWLQPALPNTAAAIERVLGGGPIRRCAPLFPRIEATAASNLRAPARPLTNWR
jgi:methionyl-tRNA synthetase